MGLPPIMPRKPMASMKPSASLGHLNSPVPSHPGHGMITHGELGKITDKLHHMGERGTQMTEALQKEADMHGGVLKARHLDRAIDEMKRDRRSGIGSRDIERLRDIVDPSL